jgi:hypothetical protein
MSRGRTEAVELCWPMAKRTPQMVAAELTVPERMPLFCTASNTDWGKAGVSHATAKVMPARQTPRRGTGHGELTCKQLGLSLAARNLVNLTGYSPR